MLVDPQRKTQKVQMLRGTCPPAASWQLLLQKYNRGLFMFGGGNVESKSEIMLPIPMRVFLADVWRIFWDGVCFHEKVLGPPALCLSPPQAMRLHNASILEDLNDASSLGGWENATLQCITERSHQLWVLVSG